MIRRTKREGGRGKVLWIEESGVHPGSGLEHGRSAQQELEWGARAGEARYVPFSTPVQTPSWRYVPPAARPASQLARATRGSARVLLAVCSETVASQTHGRVGRRLEMQLSGLPCDQGACSYLPLAAGLVFSQSRLPELRLRRKDSVASSGVLYQCTYGRAVLLPSSRTACCVLCTTTHRLVAASGPKRTVSKRTLQWVPSLVQPVEFPQFHGHSVL